MTNSSLVQILLVLTCVSVSKAFTTTTKYNNNDIQAAVLIPGFLTGANDFKEMCTHLEEAGIPTLTVPMPNWHWLPCLGGRSARPILERIDFTVKHLIANDGDVTRTIPNYQYSFIDCWNDFWTNPGGVAEVGGTSNVDEFPTNIDPQGVFPLPPQSDSKKKIALIGHSAGGWIARAYLSSRAYGGRAYCGTDYCHSLVTLGTPHADAPGPAFASIRWLVQEEPAAPIPSLAVSGKGFDINDWGGFTQGSYAFCCPDAASDTTGDGVTPLESALAFEGAEKLEMSNMHHFCWGDVFGGSTVSPELTTDYNNGRLWYGSKEAVNEWSKFLLGRG